MCKISHNQPYTYLLRVAAHPVPPGHLVTLDIVPVVCAISVEVRPGSTTSTSANGVRPAGLEAVRAIVDHGRPPASKRKSEIMQRLGGGGGHIVDPRKTASRQTQHDGCW